MIMPRRCITLCLLAIVLLLSASKQEAVAAYYTNAQFKGVFTQNYNYAQRKGAKVMLQLAKFCFDAGMPKYARRCYNDLQALRPNMKAPNKYLCRVKYGKEWISARQRDSYLAAKNKGLERWGNKYVSNELKGELIKAERERVGWNFNNLLSPEKGEFKVYCGCGMEKAFNAYRLVESILYAYNLEFAKGLGKAKYPFEVHCFENANEMKAFLDKKGCSVEAKTEACCIKGSKIACCIYSSSGNIVEAASSAILDSLGITPDIQNYWVYSAFISYFRIACETEDSVYIGLLGTDLSEIRQKAGKLASNGLLPNLEVVMNCNRDRFSKQTNNDYSATAWAVFYVVNHEYQGLLKKGFHSFLKKVASGRADFKNLSRIKYWGKVSFRLSEMISFLQRNEYYDREPRP